MATNLQTDDAYRASVVRLITRYDYNYQRGIALTVLALDARAVGRPADPGAGTTLLSNLGNDVLRSAIVFMHAALDDFLRSVGRLRYPLLQGTLLDSVPLAGGTSTKFTLSAVAAHAGLTVAEVVQRSVDEFFSRKSLNSPAEVMHFLKTLEIECPEAAPTLPFLGELMTRRHRIVHQADLSDEGSGAAPNFTYEEADRVRHWFQACDAFAHAVVAKLAPPAIAQKAADQAATILQRFQAETAERSVPRP